MIMTSVKIQGLLEYAVYDSDGLRLSIAKISKRLSDKSKDNIVIFGRQVQNRDEEKVRSPVTGPA